MVAPTEQLKQPLKSTRKERLEDELRRKNIELSDAYTEIARMKEQFAEAHKKIMFQKASVGMTDRKELDSCTLVERVNLNFTHDVIKQNFNPDGMLKDVLKLKSEGWKIGKINFERVE
jgi:hypothetical protein